MKTIALLLCVAALSLAGSAYAKDEKNKTGDAAVGAGKASHKAAAKVEAQKFAAVKASKDIKFLTPGQLPPNAAGKFVVVIDKNNPGCPKGSHGTTGCENPGPTPNGAVCCEMDTASSK